ncbi:DNA polymerase III subunit alpha [Campylobacter sp. RM12321]|uniref:DNA polymerase III subunit alpha n=1 Tax=Campylobacter sputorum TaxID=206 RepID=UPI000B7954C8|nr:MULTISPECIES: DNA polymerase III subunit alpha [Campylobacter]ASM39605.1 DNA polymerase III, alpha subunit [Campylobacter sputorum]MBF6676602.1 DNA polymerase III subunit alpha [Campylobacter sp. RM12321]
MSKFTHLHLHTEYSLLDGANKIKELASTLKEQGIGACAITDHGNMFGAIDFYKTMKANGIKPLIGMEAYVHNGDDIEDKSTKQRFHLILIAKNETGYKNLMYLSSMAYIKGFYYYPRINKKVLREHSDGLICSSACLAGEVNWHLNLSERNTKYGAKGYERAKEVALEYKDIFGDDFYLEIMRHGINEQRAIDDQILQISKETGIKVIATNDAHYTLKQRAEAHEVFMCIAMKKTLNDKDRLRHSVHEFYVKTDEQMREIFADIPEVIENTAEIVDKCNLELHLGDPTPPNFKFTTQYAKEMDITLPEPDNKYSFANDALFFEIISKRGLEERLKFIPQDQHKLYKDRLDHEIAIIDKMKFPGYMLIVWDFIREAKDRGVPVGPGRGSAAGSLVAYSLKITDIDPLPYNLLFERFLNPDRISMPDIDVDFCQDRRGEIIDYVIQKYGCYNVAQVATFGKLLAKGVIRDVARVCDMPYKEADEMAKLIPDELKITLSGYLGKDGKMVDGALQKEPKITELISSNPLANQIWRFANDLEGLNRNAGMHAAGVVISNEPLWNKTPLFKQSNGEDGHYVTQYTKDYLEDVDLIKFDFLGLKTLTVINNALMLIKRRYDKDILWEEIDFNEKDTYKLIQSGKTLGVFQIESGGMQELGIRLKPDCFEDIIAMIALYRPGPMDLIPDFIDRKHGKAKVEYLIDDIKEILEPTYGIIVYQEQVMQIVQKIGGFSLGEADLVRRAMGKKEEKKLAAMKEKYLDGAKRLGYDVSKADELFELIMKFASYGFNKSHAAAYSLITFQTAYLKAHYPAEFMAALLTSEENNADKLSRYMDEIKRLDIELLPPSINMSIREFSVVKDGKSIIYGLGAIKGVGLGAIENIIEQRGDGFKDIDDFVSKVDSFKVNKKVIESLIKSGAMSALGLTRMCLLRNVENILEACKSSDSIKKNAKESLFGEDESMSVVRVDLLKTDEELPLMEILGYELETLGIYLSGHPLKEYEEKIRVLKDITFSNSFGDINGSRDIKIVAKIEDIETKITKKGNKMGIIKLLDLYGTFSMSVFEKSLDLFLNLSSEDKQKPFIFAINLTNENSQINARFLSMANLDEAENFVFTPRKNRNFYQKPQKNETQKVYENLEVSIDIQNLNQEIINKIYSRAHFEHKNGGDKKLTLIVQTKSQHFIYKTDFLVTDGFEENIHNIA